MPKPRRADDLELSLAAAKTSGLDAYLDEILDQALGATQAPAGSLMLVNARDNVVEIVKCRGPAHDPRKKHRTFQVGVGVAGMVVATSAARTCRDVREEPGFRPPRGGLNFLSLLVVPIVAHERAIGCICVDSPKPGYFTERHRRALLALAGRAASAIELMAVDTYISHARRLAQLDSLYDVAQQLSSLTFESPDQLPRILDQIATDAELVLRADLITLYDYEQSTRTFGHPPRLRGRYEHPEYMHSPVHPNDVPDLVVRNGAPRYSEHADRDAMLGAGKVVRGAGALPDRRSFVDRERVCSSAAVPLVAAGETVGVMFVNYRTRHPFTADEQHVIETFAAYAALAIQGARRLRDAINAQSLRAIQMSARMVAHRLQNVLPVITYSTRKVSRLVDPAVPCARWLEMAYNEGLRAQRIVQDFRAYARSEPFRCQDRLTSAELVGMVEEAVKRSLPNRGVQIEVECSADTHAAMVNSERIKDDFANFATDSVRLRAKGLRIGISCRRATEQEVVAAGLRSGAGYLSLEYADNGPGVPPENKESIFEPLFTTRTGGSGLGLAISRYNASVHGGRIVERGIHGKGVRFCYFLPIRPNPAGE